MTSTAKQTTVLPHAVMDRVLNPRSGWLLCWLYRHCDGRNDCAPSIKRLAADCRVALNTAAAALRDLEQAGLVVATKVAGGRTRITLATEPATEPKPMISPQDEVQRLLERDRLTPEKLRELERDKLTPEKLRRLVWGR